MIPLRNNQNPLIAPDHRSYNHLIRYWVKTKQLNSAEKSYWWLRRMWEEYNETGNDGIRPNVHTYNTIMVPFSQLVHTVKVKHLLFKVLDHNRSKDTLLRPNKESLFLVINSWITNDASSSRYNIGERLRYALDADIIFIYPNVFFDITKLD